jgi:peptide/nickel transport system permease protein
MSVVAIAAAPRSERGYWRESGGRLAESRVALASAALLAVFGILALTAPLISHYITGYGPNEQDLVRTFNGPSAKHWLGTDELGRDTLTRLLWGARVTLGVALLAVSVQLTIGTAVGLVAGFYGRWIDGLAMRFVDSVLAFPDIFLYMLIAVLIRPTPVALAFIIASVGWADVSRLIRAEVLVLKNEDYILASRSVGASNLRLMLGHILRNALPIIIVTASVRVGQVILIEAALDFLGLGIQPPTPEWGELIADGQQFVTTNWELTTFPGIAVCITALGLSLFADGLADVLRPSA